MKKMLRLTAVLALIFALACAGLASAEIFAPHGEGQIGVGAVVASEEVAIYDKPSEDAKVVETLPFGHTLILMAMEDDCGMIDGIINNGPKQPSVAELETQVKAGQTISLMDLAAAVQTERKAAPKAKEDRPSIMDRLKQPVPKQANKTAPHRSAEREI